MKINRSGTENRLRKNARSLSGKLAESEPWHHLLFDAESDAIFLLDCETMLFLDANKAALKLYGYSLEEFVTLRHIDVSGEPEKTERSLRNRDTRISLRLHKKKDGTVFPVEISGSYFESRGRLLHVAIIRNISERLKAEAALQLFRALIDRTKDCIEVIDPETGRFLDANEEACRYHGYSREEYLHLSLFDIDPGVDRSRFKQNTKKLRELGGFRHESVHRRKDGSTFPVETDINYVQLDRGYVVAVVRDITERKRAENAMKENEERLKTQTKELEQKNLALMELAEHIERTKNKIKDDMAANVSETILPLVKKLRLKGASQKYAALLELHLKDLAASFGRKITDQQTGLSPKEIEICNALKGSLTSKEISELMGISSKTVDCHRRNIRKKLALTGKKINLHTHLKAL